MKSQSYKTIKQFTSRFCASRRGRLRRMLLTALFTGGSIVAAISSAAAAETRPAHLGGISILVHEFIPQNDGTMSSAEELDAVAKSLPVHRTSSQFNQSIAAAVGASATRIGIPVEQFLEPYAIVGQSPSSTYSAKSTVSEPIATTTLDATPAIEQQPQAVVAFPSQQQQLDDVAALECWWFDENVVDWLAEIAEMERVTANLAAAQNLELVTEVPTAMTTDIVTEAESLIGSAPVIATIPDAYFPYDFAKRDLELDYLSLTTVQPIRPKNYVSMPPQAVAEEVSSEAIELAVSEPAIEASPDCVLDELLHKASNLASQSKFRDFSFTKLGESLASWLTLPTDGSARRELTASSDIVVETPPAPVAEQVVEDAIEAPVTAEVAVFELAIMEIAGQLVPAPVVDNAPNAVTVEQLVSDDSETPATVEIAVSQIVTIDAADEDVAALFSDETMDDIAAPQIAFSEIAAPETTSTATADLSWMTMVDASTIARVMDTINQWQQSAAASITTQVEASTLPSTEVAEKADSSNENVIR